MRIALFAAPMVLAACSALAAEAPKPTARPSTKEIRAYESFTQDRSTPLADMIASGYEIKATFGSSLIIQKGRSAMACTPSRPQPPSVSKQQIDDTDDSVVIGSASCSE